MPSKVRQITAKLQQNPGASLPLFRALAEGGRGS